MRARSCPNSSQSLLNFTLEFSKCLYGTMVKAQRSLHQTNFEVKVGSFVNFRRPAQKELFATQLV